MRAHSGRKRCIKGHLLRDKGRTHFVEAQAAVLLRHVSAQQIEVPRLAQKFAGKVPVFLVELLRPRNYFFAHELLGSTRKQLLFIADVFFDKDMVRTFVGEQKAATLRGCFDGRLAQSLDLPGRLLYQSD